VTISSMRHALAATCSGVPSAWRSRRDRARVTLTLIAARLLPHDRRERLGFHI